MAIRKLVFANNEVYHIFNRGVARSEIFLHTKHYLRFIQLLEYYHYSNIVMSYSTFKKLELSKRNKIFNTLKLKNDPQVSVLSYCLMPNHFHILLRQERTYGISSFMRHVQDGYAKYFNIASKRVGPLYQSSFKAVRIESDEQLIHVSRYIHLNPATAFLVSKEKLSTYAWSSLHMYIEEPTSNVSLVDTNSILSFFRDKVAYKQFVYDQFDYQRALGKIKHLTFD